MKRLVLSICLVAFAFCAKKKPYPELHWICRNDTFDFEGREVNSYFIMQLNFSLPTLQELLLHYDRDLRLFESILNAQELRQLISKKNEFNQIVEDFYQQDKINKQLTATDILKARKEILDIRKFFGSPGLGKAIDKTNWMIMFEWVKVFRHFDRSNEFLQDLFTVKNSKLNEKIVPEHFLVYLQSYLAKKLRFGHQAAYMDHKFYYPYIERILRFDNVTLRTYDSRLFASLVVPIWNLDERPAGACTSASELPPFYREYLL